MSLEITIAYHGHCFDGMASAALMSRFLRSFYGERACFGYRGLDHQPGGSFVPERALDGDVNAVVDFRYTTSSRLDWYYDHHPSGVHAEQRPHLEADTTGRKVLDTSYGSCARLIADVTAARFGFRAPELDELVGWADIIDAARFPDAQAAVRRDTPALELTMLVEASDSGPQVASWIERLAAGEPLAEIVADRTLREQLVPLRAKHERGLEAVRKAARCEGAIVRFELPPDLGGRYPKFAPYFLYPESSYAVGVVPRPTRVGITVGHNPWAPVPRRHHVASLCERYGGGGHAAVGGITLPAGELERARAIAREVAAELSRS